MEENKEKPAKKSLGIIRICFEIILIIATIVFLVLFIQTKMSPEEGSSTKKKDNPIEKLAKEIQEIDDESILYTSFDNETVVVVVPNYSDATKKDQLADIKETLEEGFEDNKDLKDYSKLLLIEKTNSEDKKDYFYIINGYSLPDMKEVKSDFKTYIDFVQFTTEMYSNSSTSSSTSSSSSSSSSKSSTSSTTEKGEDITLSTGNYVVGEDVKPGKYDLVAVDGTSGNIYIARKVNEVLSDKSDGREKSYKNVTLTTGETIEISNGLHVLLQAK